MWHDYECLRNASLSRGMRADASSLVSNSPCLKLWFVWHRNRGVILIILLYVYIMLYILCCKGIDYYMKLDYWLCWTMSIYRCLYVVHMMMVLNILCICIVHVLKKGTRKCTLLLCLYCTLSGETHNTTFLSSVPLSGIYTAPVRCYIEIQSS